MLAIREEQLVAQQGANARRQATESAAAQRIAAEAEAGRQQVNAEAEAARTRTAAEANADAARLRSAANVEDVRALGAANAEAEAAKMAVYSTLDPNLLLALGLRELAGQLPEIGTLNISPDVLTSALSKLAGGSASAGS